ncbi:MAG: hypothetical protein KKH88_02050 [Nanoarchaeota archaeon]|nr:hypothetical protein [Nanoarchaeota archaeon]
MKLKLLIILILLLFISGCSNSSEYSRYFCTINGEKISLQEFQDLTEGNSRDSRLKDSDSLISINDQYDYCECYPKEGKDKFAVIMLENSKYSSEKVTSKLREYMSYVYEDVGIENVGIIYRSHKDNTTEMIEDLYLNKDVGYVLFLGEDLILDIFGLNKQGESSFDPHKSDFKLQFPSGSERDSDYGCPNVIVSALVAPATFEYKEQEGYILEQLGSYISFHRDPERYLNGFSRSYIRIVNLDVSQEYTELDISSPDINPDIHYTWDLPRKDILSSDNNLRSEIFEEKPVILQIIAHGWTRWSAWCFMPEGDCGNVDDWVEFTKNFTPSVLISVESCGSAIINDYGDPYIGSADDSNYCCFSQAYLGSGALAYFAGAEARHYDLIDSDFFGQAIRKRIILPSAYFGDLFAHL